MNTQIFPRYIHRMCYYLLAMSDEKVDEFDINDSRCRAELFDAMKFEFDKFGPVSKQKVLEALGYIFYSGQLERLWGWIVPQGVDVDDVEDKPAYLRALYERLSGYLPLQRDFGSDVEMVKSAGPHGVDVRE